MLYLIYIHVKAIGWYCFPLKSNKYPTRKQIKKASGEKDMTDYEVYY